MSDQPTPVRPAEPIPPKPLRLASLVVKTLAGTITALAMLLTFFTIGPALETWAWPAVSKVSFDSITEQDGETVLHVRFNKLRNCEYIGIGWFRGSKATSFVKVPIELRRPVGDNSSPNRPLGAQRTGPWIVSMSMDQLMTNSFAQLYHRCHPLWLTTTDFFP